MMTHSRRATIVVVFLSAALAFGQARALAQDAGSLSGSIVDAVGSGLPGVRVTVRGSTTREVQTDERGAFAFAGLPEGEYALSAELNGFQPIVRRIRVRTTERSELSLTMQLATVEETIVTAAKVGPDSVQSLPLAISAVSHDEISRQGVQTIEQSAALAPSVTLSQNTGFAQLTIRGIGTNVINAGADPSSAMYLDGVYLARPAMAFVEFLDIDRVEVLRGPQGTLYGRNAVGGAINVIPRAPTNDFEASARFAAGGFDALRAEVRASGPLKRGKILGSVAFVRGVRDGYVRDLEHPDHPLGGDDSTGARGQVRFLFDRRTSLLVSSDFSRQEGVPLTFNKVLQAKPGFTFDNPTDLREVRASAVAWNRTRHSGTTARLTTTLTPATTLTSISAYRALDFEYFVDADMTELDLMTTHQHEVQHQWSEEVTVSHQQSRLTVVGGLFLFSEDDDQRYWVDSPPAGVQIQLAPHVNAQSKAIFGQATVVLTPWLSTTAGLRYTNEHKDIDNGGGRYTLANTDVPVPGSVYRYDDSIAHSAWTPKLGVETRLPKGALAYFSAARGFKSGGFNPSSTVPGRGYAPEWVWNYEGGLKGSLMNGRARYAATAFIMDYTNLQVQTPIQPGIFDISNAAAASIRGVELENTTRLGPGLVAGGHLTWLDATYDRYIAVGLGGVTGDAAGKRLNNAPEWAGRLWIEWTGGVGHGQLTLTADSTAQSTVFYTPFNDTVQRQNPYGLLNTRAEYGPAHRRWSINAYVRNLTDTDFVVATFGTSPAAFAGRPGAARQFAIEFSVRP
jgi:iron complex outermembrane receptor protein